MTTRTCRLVAAVVATLATVFALVVVPAAPAAAWPTPTIEVIRKGLGHGRGMGQWGALGYAVNHGWDYKQILAHYYRGTNEGSAGNPVIDVQLMKFNNADTLVQQERGEIAVSGIAALPPGTTGIRVRRGSPGALVIEAAPSCGGPWGEIGVSAGPVVISPTNPQGDDHTHMLQACESNPTANRWYRGQIIASNGDGAVNGGTALDRITMNRVTMNEYLRGVVPRESPASWGSVGGGKGLQALKAQAVAARSYATGEDRPGPPKTCDTVTCQVYGGRALQNGAGFVTLEAASTNQAVDETQGEVRTNGSGAVVRTEFSASTGGWTTTVANGNPYGPVEDLGDSICVEGACNPYHRQTSQLDVATIEARQGLGSLQGVEVLARDGLGEFGGRITSLRLHFSGGSRTFNGEEAVRSALGNGSTWVEFTGLGAFPYHVVTRDGGVFSFNGAQFHGSLPGIGIKTPVKDITEGPPGQGYWLLGEDGGVFSFDVPFYGSMGGRRLNSPVVGMEATIARQGYWLVAGDGGIFSFGDAPFFGSTGNMRLNKPVVGMSPHPGGGGYWMVATDGGVFSFGNLGFFGSTGAMRLNQPVFAMAATPSGNGYWLVARDGGVFSFGDAQFFGSLPGRGVKETAVEMLPSPTGGGYLIVTAEGHVYGFGNAPSAGGPRDVGAGPAPAVGAGRVPQ